MILTINLEKKERLIEFSVFDSILFLSFFFFLVYIHKYRFSLFLLLKKKSVERIEKLMTLKSSAERPSDRARTITFVDKEGGEREREHDFCCPHNYIKKKE